MIDKLEKKSFIKRKENKNDKRAFSLFLADKAKEQLPIIEEYEKKVLDSIVKNINTEEADKFIKILELIRNNISET